MPYVRSFDNVSPPPRFDGVPFTIVRILEAAAAAGPFAEIDSEALAPVDADPSAPALRDITTASAVYESGAWYQLVWEDGVGAQYASPAVQYLTGDVAVRPTADEVALLLRTRTVGGIQTTGLGSDTGPADLTTFTAETRPNLAEVERVIDQSVEAVEGALVGVVPAGSEGRVRHAVALYAAVMIEGSFFREQADDAAVQLWRDLYDAIVRSVNAKIVDVTPIAGSRGFGDIRVGTTLA